MLVYSYQKVNIAVSRVLRSVLLYIFRFKNKTLFLSPSILIAKTSIC